MIKLKSIEHGSGLVDLQSWCPSNVKEEYFELVLEIGIDGQDGADIFYVLFSTIDALRIMPISDYLVVTNRVLVAKSFNYEELVHSIDAIISDSTRDTWSETSKVLQRYFLWEYEDYNM